jgi:segregation and condensation protein A
VGRFLALLELYRDQVIAFDQAAALAELQVRWVGSDEAADASSHAAEVDEEYS